MFVLTKSKRLMLMYAVMLMWLILGIFGIAHSATIPSLTAYFLSLTGFVAVYIWGESVRPSPSTSLLKKGRNSTREVLIYVCVLMWAVVGAFGVLRHFDLSELAVYYTTLTPFVGAYILGVTYRPLGD